MFPVYRKYANNQRYFKVLDAGSFHEVQVMGKKFQQYRITAKSYPERLFISDLIACNFEGVLEMTEDDFKATLAELGNTLEEIKPRQN